MSFSKSINATSKCKFLSGDSAPDGSTRRSSESSATEPVHQPCSHMLYNQNLMLQPISISSYLMQGGTSLGPTSPSGTSGSTEPLQQLYDEMYNLDASPATLPGTFSPLPPSSPTYLSVGQYHGSPRRFSYPNSPIHGNTCATGNEPCNSTTTTTTSQNVKPNLAEPTRNIAASLAEAAQMSNTSNQIAKHLQQLKLQHGGSSNCTTANSETSASSIKQLDSTANKFKSSVGKTNSVDSTSNFSSLNVTTGSSNYTERIAAAKNRWKAKGSITQGHVPQRQHQSINNSSSKTDNNSLQTPHANLAHSHSFDDAFEGGKGAQLLHRRHTHHR